MKEFKQHMDFYLKNLESCWDKLKIQREIVINNSKLLGHYSTDREEFFIETISDIDQELKNIVSLISQLELWKDSEDYGVFFKRFIDLNLSDLDETPLRTLILLFVKRVTIDFDKETAEINYRSSPLVTLERDYERITEN